MHQYINNISLLPCWLIYDALRVKFPEYCPPMYAILVEADLDIYDILPTKICKAVKSYEHVLILQCFII